jgi:septal ring factor EnvC (AmiA/AmiB activator)
MYIYKSSCDLLTIYCLHLSRSGKINHTYPSFFCNMRSKLFLAWIICVATLLVGIPEAYAQTPKKKKPPVSEKSKLEQQKKRLVNDISATGKLLKETEKKHDAALQRAGLLSTKIQQRNALIVTYATEVELLDTKITENRREINRLENNLQALKSSYKKMVFHAYKNRESTDQLLYLLAAENINTAYRRLNYFKQVGEFRKLKAEKIKSVKSGITQAVETLEADKASKTTLLTAETDQRKMLESEKKEQEVLATQLKGKEAELKKKIDKAEGERVNLEARIRKIINDEIEAERKRAEAKALADAKKKADAAAKANATKPATSTNTNTNAGTTAAKPAAPKEVVMTVTPETRALSNSFEGNRGVLPWPVEKGAISSNFGTHPHAVLKNITVKNDGIDITAPSGSSARAVFGGTVSGIFSVEGYGRVVIIRHGEYLTVYSNLSDVSVSRDQKIKAKDRIGDIETAENGKSVMNFQIRKGASILNPSGWLAR